MWHSSMKSNHNDMNRVMNKRLIRTQSHEEWLQVRSNGIGSSEVGTILGLNPYETPYQLWRRKTWQDPPKEENEAMLLGHLLEDAVAQRWAIATGREIVKASAEEWIYVHPNCDYFRASPDRIYYEKGEKHNEANKCILECKTTVLDVDEDNIPQSWFCQVQWLMHVTGYKRASLAWLKLDRRQFGYKDITYDAGLCEWMAQQVDVFWNVYVQGGEEPPFVNVKDILTKFSKHVDGKTISSEEKVEVDGETMKLLEAVRNVKAIKESIAELEGQKEQYENAIKAAMCDAEAVTHEEGGRIVNLVTWRAAKDSLKFDAKAYQKEHPEEAQAYMKSVAGSRRFLIK